MGGEKKKKNSYGFREKTRYNTEQKIYFTK